MDCGQCAVSPRTARSTGALRLTVLCRVVCNVVSAVPVKDAKEGYVPRLRARSARVHSRVLSDRYTDSARVVSRLAPVHYARSRHARARAAAGVARCLLYTSPSPRD